MNCWSAPGRSLLIAPKYCLSSALGLSVFVCPWRLLLRCRGYSPVGWSSERIRRLIRVSTPFQVTSLHAVTERAWPYPAAAYDILPRLPFLALSLP